MRPALPIASALLVFCAMPAAAQTRTDPYQHAAISAGDYARAERALRAEQRIYPDSPEVLLNLAAVLARTSRADAARPLYERVLANKDVSLTLSGDRVVNAHEVAQTGLRSLDLPVRTQVSAR